MNNITKPTIVLTVIAFAAAFALSHINRITRPSIEKQEREKQEAALKAVLPAGFAVKEERNPTVEGKQFRYWIAEGRDEKGAVSRAYAFIAEKGGYSGPVRSMVGVDEKGILLGISVLQQSETPGLGARAIEIASRETFWGHFFGIGETPKDNPLSPWFQEQFKGLDTNKKIEILKKGDWNPSMREELLSKNGISAITGATVTSKAVRDSIALGIETLHKAVQLEAGTRQGAK
jgi:electron transport complex protein RnfG